MVKKSEQAEKNVLDDFLNFDVLCEMRKSSNLKLLRLS